MLNHLLPGVILLLSGIGVLMGDESEHIRLPWLNILVGLAALVIIIYEFRFSHSEKHTIVNWVDIVAGFVLLLEGINHYHPNKIFQPALFYIIIAVATCGMGIFHARIARLWRLEIDETGFFIRLSPFKKVKMKWADISSMKFGDSSINIVTTGNRRARIPLRQIDNKEEVTGIFKKMLNRKKIETL
jgi:uncharacterized membrane protein YobD (UPF0266 family)